MNFSTPSSILIPYANFKFLVKNLYHIKNNYSQNMMANRSENTQKTFCYTY